MLQKIIQLDQWLFLKINQEWRNAVFDTIMPLLREAKFWIPFYLFLGLFVLVNFGHKLWHWLLFGLLTITLTDSISSRIFKPWFDRRRPCADPEFGDSVRLLLEHCSSSGSFTSSHAANHFGLAMFLFISFRSFIKKPVRSLFFLWAFAICWAQIYVGVHYPMDILGGAIIGIVVGGLCGMIFNNRFGLEAQDGKLPLQMNQN